MSRNRTTISKTKYSQTKQSKGGYSLNKNGVPLDYKGYNALNSSITVNYQYKGTLHIGRYRPTVHNITDI